MHIVLGILLVLGTASGAYAQADPIDRLVTLPAAPWGLAAGDLDGDGDREVVFGAIDNMLYVYDDGTVRPVADVGGYAMDVVCLDVDGDGQDEIFCAVADWQSYTNQGAAKKLAQLSAVDCGALSFVRKLPVVMFQAIHLRQVAVLRGVPTFGSHPDLRDVDLRFVV